MFDCHCHILPGVDDGAADLDESISMLQATKQIGITHMIATPHIRRIPVDWDALKKAYQLLLPEAEKLQIKLQLGYELYAPVLSSLSFDTLKQFCITDTNRLLIEFHPDHLPNNLAAYFNEILSRNIVPIIAHPERYGLVQESPAVLKDCVQLGCYLQINGRSINANPFDGCSNTAKKLLKLYPSAFLSSDAHCVEHYRALAKAQQKYSRMRKDLP